MPTKKKPSRTISKKPAGLKATAHSKRTHVETKKKFGVRLVHHRHTGRKVGISHTSYAALYFLLILTGATLFFANRSAQAVDQVVNGSVNLTGRMKGPVPQNPAVFIEPTNGSRTNTNTAVVRGSCQAGLYIELFRYSTFAGSTLCGNNGEFQMTVTLKPGQNDFIAKMSDADSQYAPDSSVLTIFYDVPQKPLTVSGSGNTSTKATNPNDPTTQNVYNPPGYTPLIVTTVLPRTAFPINKEATFKYTILGGQPAYAVLINWDDGTQSDLRSVSNPGEQNVTHKFKKSGQHVITITVSDALNNKAIVQTIVSVTREYTGVASTVPAKCQPGNPEFFSAECYVNNRVVQILDAVWPALIVASLMTLSFWFGERIVYTRYGSHTRRRAH